MPHRALVTGVTGFVGGYLAEFFLGCGDAVQGCSASGHWRATAPAILAERVELLTWDISDPAGMTSGVRRAIEQFAPDWIVHLAALSNLDQCGRDRPTPEAVAVNVDGTRRVLELAATMAQRPRVLMVSTSHVYALPVRGAPPVDETARLIPYTGYGQTKRAAEEAVQRCVEAGACDALIARAFAHGGPRQIAAMMLPQWAEQFARGANPVRVYNRDVVLDLSDVRDVVRAYRLLLVSAPCGAVYNVGSGVPHRSGEILEMLRTLADPQREIVELYPGPRQDPVADIGRITRQTGWRPQIPLEQTVADTWSWWQEYSRRRLSS
jgi:GDP-4-dehydro-6-deoxy-D-mannose reductase